MMLSNFMYLRNQQYWKTCEVCRWVSENINGYLKQSYRPSGEMVRGIITQSDMNAAERTKHMWDQDKHSLSHTMVTKPAAKLRKNDLLCPTDSEKAYLVLACDDVDSLGVSGLVYLEERDDLKG